MLGMTYMHNRNVKTEDIPSLVHESGIGYTFINSEVLAMTSCDTTHSQVFVAAESCSQLHSERWGFSCSCHQDVLTATERFCEIVYACRVLHKWREEAMRQVVKRLQAQACTKVRHLTLLSKGWKEWMYAVQLHRVEIWAQSRREVDLLLQSQALWEKEVMI